MNFLKTYLIVGLLGAMSVFSFSDTSFTLSQNNGGYMVIGDETDDVLSLVISSDETCSITQLKFTLAADTNTSFDDDSGISDITVTNDSTDISSGFTIVSTTEATVTITGISYSGVADTDTLGISFTVTDGAGVTSPDTAATNITVDQEAGDCTVTTDTIGIQETGVDIAFVALIPDTTGPGDQTRDERVFDVETDDDTPIVISDFELTINTNDEYTLSEIVIQNSEGNFDYDADGDGITKVYLYADDGDTIWESSDELLKEADADDFTSATELTLSSINKSIDENTRFYLLYEMGVSTNILDDDEDAIQVNVNITSISGTGVDSSYTYGPINVTSELNNDLSISLAGLAITEVENIFPSMNASAGLTDIPLLKFTAKAVGIEMRLAKLVLENDLEIFSTTSSEGGLTKLTWLLDDGNGTYDGKSNETVVDEIDLDGTDDTDIVDTDYVDTGGSNSDNNKDSNTEDEAMFLRFDSESDDSLATDAVNDFDSDEEKVFFILGDFGSSMIAGQTVSLNISEDTQAYYNSDRMSYNDTDVEDNELEPLDDESTLTNIGSNLPLTINPTQNITLVDPVVRIQTDFLENPELFDDDDSDGFRDSGENGTNLVSGMYDLLMYVITADVFESVTDLTMTFDSPEGSFSETSSGISKVSLYLDVDLSSALSEGDVFLSSVSTFTNAGTTATLSNIALPKGSNQQLLLMIDLGQRVGVTVDKISIQLTGATASNGDVSGLLSNPIAPSSYSTEAHLIEISAIQTDISTTTNLITQDDSFIVQVQLGALEDSDSNDVDLLLNSSNNEPLSTPKFYYEGVSGEDRSYELTTTFSAVSSTTDWDAAFNDTSTQPLLSYSVSAADITTEGNYLIDADIYYEIESDEDYVRNQGIRLTRSKGAGTDYKSALELSSGTGTAVEPSISTTNDSYSWTLPNLISSVNVKVNNQFTSFYNYQSIPQGTQMQIVFANEGRDVDVNSISITLNGEELESEEEANASGASNYFSYDVTSGTALIQSVGDTSGQIVVSSSDLMGFSYPNLPIIFYTSDQLEINQFLVYPNPYSPSLQSSVGLTFGFSLTAAATVTVYVYDATGRELSVTESTSKSMGYNTITWDSEISRYGKFLPSGTYYLKMIATDDDGASVSQTTKLAVY